MDRRIILFLVDGMRPDGLAAADTPNIDRLAAGGAWTMRGQTIMPSMTLPCHTSLFLGVTPERHGITTNIWTPPVRPVPGLFDLIHQSGGATASFYNWEELRDLSRPGSLDAAFFLKNCELPDGAGDRILAETAAGWLANNPVNFAFIYLGYTDIAGHLSGWMSDPYLAGIANADFCIGQICSVLSEADTVLVTSDHGGHAKTHGTDCSEDMTIPFVIHGPRIPAGFEIRNPFSILDIAPTVAHLLGLDLPREWMGRPLAF